MRNKSRHIYQIHILMIPKADKIKSWPSPQPTVITTKFPWSKARTSLPSRQYKLVHKVLDNGLFHFSLNIDLQQDQRQLCAKELYYWSIRCNAMQWKVQFTQHGLSPGKSSPQIIFFCICLSDSYVFFGMELFLIHQLTVYHRLLEILAQIYTEIICLTWPSYLTSSPSSRIDRQIVHFSSVSSSIPSSSSCLYCNFLCKSVIALLPQIQICQMV